MTKTDELREKIADTISEAAQTKAELLSDKSTSDYQHGWQSGLMYALEEIQKLLAILPAQPDVSGLVGALERIVSIEPIEEDPGDEYGFSNCQIMGHNEGVAECQDIARQALKDAQPIGGEDVHARVSLKNKIVSAILSYPPDTMSKAEYMADQILDAAKALTLSATPESGEAALSIGSALVTIDADGIGYAILRDGKYVPGKVEIQTPEDLKAALTNTEGGE